MAEPWKLVIRYETGRITRRELLIELAQAAAERNPADLARGLPVDVLAELREQSAVPPATPVSCRVAGFYCGTQGMDYSTYWNNQSRLLYEGLWRWHHYFAGLSEHSVGTMGDNQA